MSRRDTFLTKFQSIWETHVVQSGCYDATEGVAHPAEEAPAAPFSSIPRFRFHYGLIWLAAPGTAAYRGGATIPRAPRAGGGPHHSDRSRGSGGIQRARRRRPGIVSTVTRVLKQVGTVNADNASAKDVMVSLEPGVWIERTTAGRVRSGSKDRTHSRRRGTKVVTKGIFCRSGWIYQRDPLSRNSEWGMRGGSR